jgi:hypothetical protein
VFHWSLSGGGPNGTARGLSPCTCNNTAIPTATVDSIMRPFLFYSLFLVPFTTVLAQVSSPTLYFSSCTTLDDVT